MKPEELKKNVEERLIDIKKKMKEIDALLQKHDVPRSSLIDAHRKLKTWHDEIILQYDQIDAMKTSEQKKVDEVEKNIYNSLESFDSVYKRAGALFEENEFTTRNRSVDFNNPTGTK